MYINNWNEVPDGATVIEDTYPEIYTVFTRNGKRWLRQIGWQTAPNQKAPPIPENNERECDFEPNCTYDQPWIRID